MQTPPSVARARDQLRQLYRQWQSLTQAEGDAIRRGSWPILARLQASKRLLQQSITTATRGLEAEQAAHGIGRGHLEDEFGGLVADLMQLESRNLESLEAQLRLAKAHEQELESSAARLRLIRDTYGHERPSLWHSYS